jgi:hypothetical protein
VVNDHITLLDGIRKAFLALRCHAVGNFPEDYRASSAPSSSQTAKRSLAGIAGGEISLSFRWLGGFLFQITTLLSDIIILYPKSCKTDWVFMFA